MDHHATLAAPLATVFAHLAAPERLGDWLPEVVHVEKLNDSAPGAGIAFELMLQMGGMQSTACGEMIAFEPPALVAYRFFLPGSTQVVRVTCLSTDTGTRVHVSLRGEGRPLAVDFIRLEQTMALLAHVGDNTEPRDTASVRSA